MAKATPENSACEWLCETRTVSMVSTVFQRIREKHIPRNVQKTMQTMRTMPERAERMRLQLTADQAAQIAPHLRPGIVMIGRVMREPFTGDNAATSGRLTLELGSVPEASLPALREAIRTATNLARRKLNSRLPSESAGFGIHCPLNDVP